MVFNPLALAWGRIYYLPHFCEILPCLYKPMITTGSDSPCFLNFGFLLHLTAIPLTPTQCWHKWRNQSHSSHTTLLVKWTIISWSYMATRKIMKSTLLLSYYGFSFLLLPLFSFLYPPPPQSLCVFLRHSVSTISLVTLYLSNPSPWDLTFSQELRKVSY